MDRTSLSRWALLLAALASSCTRPVAGRDVGSTLLTDLQVTPEYLRAGVPVDISFKARGLPPSSVRLDLAGKSTDCAPVRQQDDRFHCTHGGVNMTDFVQGPTLVVVETRDKDGKSSVVSRPIHLDFECPRFLSLSVVPAIVQPGDTAVVSIQASKPLGAPPVVTHAGRAWETAVGQGQSYTVTHRVTDSDPNTPMPLIVRITDLAGNTSNDCGQDGRLTFAVDHAPPTLDADKVTVERGAPGTPSIIRAAAGAFLDDVAVKEVRVLDSSGMFELATIKPAADGSLQPTGLGSQPRTRVRLEVVDNFNKKSPQLAVRERWRTSVGGGSTPNAAIRTASRFSPAPPQSKSMRNQTVQLAPDVFEADARAATVRTRIGFEKVGDLASRYEDVATIMAGYEPIGKTIVAAGGYRGVRPGYYSMYIRDVTLIQWDEREGAYVTEQGPGLVPSLRDSTNATAPNPRAGRNMAFDGRGCGILLGGDELYYQSGISYGASVRGDVWQLCRTSSGYQWTRIPVPEEIAGQSLARFAMVAFDPIANHYFTAGGAISSDSPEVLFLETDPDPANWRWTVVPTPANFNRRSSNAVYWDPRTNAFATGLGFVSPTGGDQQSLFFTLAGGQWSSSTIPRALTFRGRAGYAFDTSRQQLLVWGGNSTFSTEPPDPDLWIHTGDSTRGPDSWSPHQLDHPLLRDYPSLVYDSDREVTVVFGGIRVLDMRPVPPEIFQIIVAPSSPHLQASIDLAGEHPKGITRLHLSVRATGTGEPEGGGTDTGAGVIVMLWDYNRRHWDDVATTTSIPASGGGTIEIDITDTPDRYVSPDGVIPVTISSRRPASEALTARLDVDLLDGYMDLRSGVTLP